MMVVSVTSSFLRFSCSGCCFRVPFGDLSSVEMGIRRRRGGAGALAMTVRPPNLTSVAANVDCVVVIFIVKIVAYVPHEILIFAAAATSLFGSRCASTTVCGGGPKCCVEQRGARESALQSAWSRSDCSFGSIGCLFSIACMLACGRGAQAFRLRHLRYHPHEGVISGVSAGVGGRRWRGATAEA